MVSLNDRLSSHHTKKWCDGFKAIKNPNYQTPKAVFESGIINQQKVALRI